MSADAHGGNDKPIRHVDTLPDGRRLVIYRASAIGGCERALLAAARQMEAKPPTDRMQAIFDEGHEAEPQILKQWDEMGGEVEWGTEQTRLELTVIDDEDVKVIVRGHVDALTNAGGTQGILECKKFRDSTWKDWLNKGVEVHQTYPWQVAALMYAWHEMTGDYPEVTMLGGRWSEGQVVELAPHYLANPPIPLRAIKKKIARIERLVDEGYMPLDDGVQCNASWPCPYFYLHDDYVAGKKSDAGSSSRHIDIKGYDEQVSKWLTTDQMYAAQLRDLAATKAKIDGARRANREMIQNWLRDNGAGPGDTATAMGYDVKWVKREVKAYEVKARVDEWVEVKTVEKKSDKKTTRAGKGASEQTGDEE